MEDAAIRDRADQKGANGKDAICVRLAALFLGIFAACATLTILAYGQGSTGVSCKPRTGTLLPLYDWLYGYFGLQVIDRATDTFYGDIVGSYPAGAVRHEIGEVEDILG
jgi:hypothetical protein